MEQIIREHQRCVNASAAFVVPRAAPGPGPLPGWKSVSEPIICRVGALLLRKLYRKAGTEFQIGEEEEGRAKC